MGLYSASGDYIKSATTEHFNNNINSMTKNSIVTISNKKPLRNDTLKLGTNSLILFTKTDINNCLL